MSLNVLPSISTATTPSAVLGAAGSATTPAAVLGSAGSAVAPVAVLGAAGSATVPKTAMYTISRAKVASLLVVINGSGHEFLLTANHIGADGNDISFEIAEVESGYETTLAVTDSAIVLTPKTKAMMFISGTTPACEPRVMFLHDGDGVPGLGLWYESEISTGTSLFSIGGTWYLDHCDEDDNLVYRATKVSANTTPEGLTGWTVVIGSGQPTIISAATSIRQAVDIINATPAAKFLVTASTLDYQFSEVSQLDEMHLTGGSDEPVRSAPQAVLAAAGSATTPGAVLGSAGSATTPGAVLGSPGSATTPAAVLGSPGSATAPLNVM